MSIQAVHGAEAVLPSAAERGLDRRNITGQIQTLRSAQLAECYSQADDGRQMAATLASVPGIPNPAPLHQ